MGQIYQVTKQLSGIQAQANIPIKDKNNNILTTEREQYLRWKEHFQKVLNRKDPDELKHPWTQKQIQIHLQKLEKKAITILKNKNAPDTDQLNAERFKIDSVLAANTLQPVFHKTWGQSCYI